MVKKRNFEETFDLPTFIGTYKVYMLDRFKRRKIDPTTKNVMQGTMPLIKGGPIPEFLRENNLDHTSLSHKWFEPFLSRTITPLWTSYTNTKALLENASNEGELYPD